MLSIVMLSVIMLSVVMLSVVMLSVVMLSVVAPIFASKGLKSWLQILDSSESDFNKNYIGKKFYVTGPR